MPHAARDLFISWLAAHGYSSNAVQGALQAFGFQTVGTRHVRRIAAAGGHAFVHPQRRQALPLQQLAVLCLYLIGLIGHNVGYRIIRKTAQKLCPMAQISERDVRKAMQMISPQAYSLRQYQAARRSVRGNLILHHEGE